MMDLESKEIEDSPKIITAEVNFLIFILIYLYLILICFEFVLIDDDFN